MNAILSLQQDGHKAAAGLSALLAEANALAFSVSAGAHGRRRAGQGETFWQYREYVSGDAASLIDWRQSARSPSRYYVREKEWETAASLRIWCNGGDSFDYSSSHQASKRDRGNVIATALSILLIKAGEKIGLLPETRPVSNGQHTIPRIAEQLLCNTDQEDFLPIPSNSLSHAIFISDFHHPIDDLQRHLKKIAGTGVTAHFVQISDPAEEDFPFKGRVLFSDGGRHEHTKLLGDAASARQEYKKIRSAHFSAFRDMCSHYGFTYLTHRTDYSPSKALGALHQSVSGQAFT